LLRLTVVSVDARGKAEAEELAIIAIIALSFAVIEKLVFYPATGPSETDAATDNPIGDFLSFSQLRQNIGGAR
jgi:hypothetical protein